MIISEEKITAVRIVRYIYLVKQRRTSVELWFVKMMMILFYIFLAMMK